MPAICWFLRIVIAMYHNEHSPPHFHAKYGDKEAVIAIASGEVIAGKLSPRVLGFVQEWRALYEQELLADWALARERKPLQSIEPLE